MLSHFTSRAAALLVPPLAVSLLAACEPAEQGPPPAAVVDTAAVSTAIDSLREAYVTAYNAGEAERVASLYATGALFLPADAPSVSGREAIQAFLGTQLAAGPTLEVTSREVRPLTPEWTFSSGTYRVSATPEGQEAPLVTSGSYLVLFQQTAEGWRLFRHAANYDSLPPGPGAR